jgi:Zn-dependent protease with chaperone function
MLHSSDGVLPEYRFADAPWQVFILNVEDPNAFSAGAGTIFITKGLLLSLPNEAALASVISHEMAHQMLGHTTEALEEAMHQPRNTPQFSFSLEREIEADSLSIQILTAARYSPRQALDALSIAYRPAGRAVSLEEKNWLTLRAANLFQKTNLGGSRAPSTVSSREFNKVRRQVAQLKLD